MVVESSCEMGPARVAAVHRRGHRWLGHDRTYLRCSSFRGPLECWPLLSLTILLVGTAWTPGFCQSQPPTPPGQKAPSQDSPGQNSTGQESAGAAGAGSASMPDAVKPSDPASGSDKNAAAAGESEPEDPAVAAVRAVMELLGQAIVDENLIALGGHLDHKVIVSEILKDPDIKLSFLERLGLRTVVFEMLRDDVFRDWALESSEVKEIDVDESATRATALLKVTDADGDVQLARFRLHRVDAASRPPNWKVYDAVDPVSGVSIRDRCYVRALHMHDENTSAVLLLYKNENLADELFRSGLDRDDDDFAPGRRVEQLTKVPVPEPLKAHGYLGLARAHYRWGQAGNAEQFEKALEYCDLAEQAPGERCIVHCIRALAHHGLGRHDQAIASAKEYIRVLPDDPRGYELCSQMLTRRNRTAEAIEVLQQGLSHSPGSSSLLLSLAEALPVDKKSSVVHWLRQSKPSAERCLELLEEAGHFLDVPTIEAVADVLEEVDPDQQNLPLVRAAARIKAEDPAGAAKVLEPHLQRLEEFDDPEDVLYEFLRCYVLMSRPLDGYDLVPDKHQALEILVDMLLEEDQRNQIERLLAWHAEKFPDDVRLHYYRGELLWHNEKYEQAEAEYARVMEQAPADERWYESALYSRVYCWQMLEKPLEAYLRMGAIDRERVFDLLVWDLWGEKDVANLAQLVATHRDFSGPLYQVVLWTAALDFHHGNYSLVHQQLLAHDKQLFDDLEYTDRDLWVDILVRSLARDGKTEQALEMARRSEYRQDTLNAVAYAAQGNRFQTRQYLVRLAVGGADEDFIAEDDDLNQLLYDKFPELAREALRQDETDRQAFVLLCQETPKVQPADVLRAAREAWGVDLNLVSTNTSSRPLPEMSYVVGNNDHGMLRYQGLELAFQLGRHPFRDEWELSQPLQNSSELMQKFESHQGWISLEVLLRPIEMTEAECLQRTLALLAKLAPQSQPILLYTSRNAQLRSYDPDLAEALQGDAPFSALEDRESVTVPLVRYCPDALDEASQEARRCWSEFVEARRKATDGTFQVLVRPAGWPAGMERWLDVIELREDGATCALKVASEEAPHEKPSSKDAPNKESSRETSDAKITPGEPAAGETPTEENVPVRNVSLDEVLDWRCLEPDDSVRLGAFRDQAADVNRVGYTPQ